MVILIELVRKFSFRSFTQYLKAVTNFIAKSISEQVSEVVDDDLRATAALSTERIGHADNLTGGFILPKSQVAKVMQEGSADSELALMLYGNDVSNPNPKDMSGWDDKIVSRVGFPCVVKTNPINKFNGRALADSIRESRTASRLQITRPSNARPSLRASRSLNGFIHYLTLRSPSPSKTKPSLR